MAVLFSSQSGNWTTSTTWKVVDPTSFANTETTVTTLTVAFQTSSAFTPGAITVEGIAVKISSRVVSPSGTITVRLSTGGAAVAGTTVTLNVSDLTLTNASVPSSFYWCYFKFTAPVLLLAATAYNVQAATSVATQVSLGYSTLAANFIRCLVTSTNATPAAGDTLIVAGEHTAAGVGVDYTVTMDNTSSTIYGSASAVFPVLEIGKRGIVNFGVSASTNYQLVCNGSINVGGGGILSIGTAGSPMPDTSSALVWFRNATANAYQINVRQFGSLYTCGTYKNARALLATNASAGATTVTASTITNWSAFDNICIAPTSASTTAFDLRTLSVTASSTTLTFTQSLTNAKTIHSGTEVEVINLTRNVRITGSASAGYAQHSYNGQVNVDLRNTEFRWGGWTNTVDTTNTSTLNFQGLSIWDATGISVIADTALPASGGSMSWSDSVFHNMQSFMSFPTATSPSIFTIDSCWGIRTASGNWISLLGNHTATMTNCRWIASAATGMAWGNNSSYNTGAMIFTNNVFKCNVSGFAISNGANTTLTRTHNVSNNSFYLNTTAGLNFQPSVGNMNGWIFSNFIVFSNPTANVIINKIGDVTLISCTFSGGPTNVSAIGISLASTDGIGVFFDNCYMTGHTTADFSNGSGGTANFLARFRNCFFGSTEIQNQSTMQSGSAVTSMRHDQQDSNHLIWEAYGTLRSDTTVFRNTSPSLKMVPISTTTKLETRPILVPVKSGQSVVTGAWVRTSIVSDAGGAYNGNFPRLIVKANTANGTGVSDIILATASAAASGAWQYLSGTLPTAIADTTFEVVLDCDGNSGFVSIDDVYFSAQNSTKGFKYWYDGFPFPSSTTQNGSAVIFL